VSATARPSNTHHPVSPLVAAEGRCNHMELRDWIELAKIELRKEEGQTMTEYGVLLALIAVGVIAVLLVLGPQIKAAFQAVVDGLTKSSSAT
jgi:pilus assembly protein Flp/PilA